MLVSAWEQNQKPLPETEAELGMVWADSVALSFCPQLQVLPLVLAGCELHSEGKRTVFREANPKCLIIFKTSSNPNNLLSIMVRGTVSGEESWVFFIPLAVIDISRRSYVGEQQKASRPKSINLCTTAVLSQLV